MLLDTSGLLCLYFSTKPLIAKLALLIKERSIDSLTIM